MNAKLLALQCEIIDLHHSLSLRPTLEAARQIGAKLHEAKKLVPYGRWLDWIKSCGLKARTVQTYLQVYSHAPETPNSAYLERPLSIEGFLRTIRRSKKQWLNAERERLRKIAISENHANEKAYRVYQADCKKYDWPEVDHIWTDPPWNELDHYRWLAELASKKLRPGGLLAVQCGQTDLPGVFSILSKTLTYYWTLALVYDQVYPTLTLPFSCSWRPVVLFCKGKWNKALTQRISDTITITDVTLQKQYHVWQQPWKPHAKWIEALTLPGCLIADPFCGTGSNGVAVKAVGARSFLGVDIDKTQVAVSRKRIAEQEEGVM